VIWGWDHEKSCSIFVAAALIAVLLTACGGTQESAGSSATAGSASLAAGSSSAGAGNAISQEDVETVKKSYGEERPVYDTEMLDLDFDGEDELLVLTAQANPKEFEVWEKNAGAMDLVCAFGAGKVNWIDEIALKQGEIDGEKAYLFSFAYDEGNSMKADEVLSAIWKTADGYEVEHLLSRGTITYPDIAEPATKEFYREGWSKYDIGMDQEHGDISKEEYEKRYKEYMGGA